MYSVCGGGVGGLQWGEVPEEIDDRSSQHYCIIYFEVQSGILMNINLNSF